MIDQTPSDDGISAMVDIARMSGQNLNPEQRRELDGLLAEGLIEKIAAADNRAPAKYAVTAKGQTISRRPRRRRQRILRQQLR